MKTLIIAVITLAFLIIGCLIYYRWIEPAIFRSILNRFEKDDKYLKDSGKKQK